MRSPSWYLLTLVLLLASAAPPPSMAVRLLSAVGASPPIHARDMPQARGRNRLSIPPGAEARVVEARRVSGSDGESLPPAGSITDPGHHVPTSARPDIHLGATLPVSALKLRC